MVAVTRIFFVLLMGIFLLPYSVRAETRYIGDTLVVALRNGPASSFSVVKTLRTGNKVDVLGEQGDYIHVSTDDDSEGWIQKQYTIADPPRGLLVPKLREKINQLILSNKHFSKEIANLKSQLTQKDEEFQNKHADILTQESENQTELARLKQELDQKTAQYDELSEQSKQFINIRDERDSLKKSLTTQTNRVNSLEDENNHLANKQMFYWFLAGGGVLFIGWLIGVTSFKKRRPTLSL